MRRLSGVVSLFLLAAAVQAANASDAPLPICDSSSLNLEIASVANIGAITSEARTVTPKPGKKIVVVHLKPANQTPKDCEWLSDLMDIEAVYRVPAEAKEIPYSLAPAIAVKIIDLMGGRAEWYFLDQGQSGPSLTSMKLNDITIMNGGVVRLQALGSAEFAFVLPEDVMNFTVRVPTSVKGIASLGPDKPVTPQAPAPQTSAPSTSQPSVPASNPRTAAAGSNQATGQASLVIDSVPVAADIEIDGVFVGSTPSTVKVMAGSHRITVKKKGFTDWTKILSVSGGTVHLSAELEKAPVQ